MLGAGGTGGHIAPHLYRLLYALERPARFIICDGDLVEAKNLVRQNFAPADLGENKARVLAERYAAVFGMEAEYIPAFVERLDTLVELITPNLWTQDEHSWRTVREMVILIGAVDNNKSRQLCHKAFYQAKDLIYIDSGNGEFSGQVVCGVRRNGHTMCKPIGGVHPEMLKDDTDKFPTELSCAEAAQSDPQSMAANITAATAVVDMVYNILTHGESLVRQTDFSTKTVKMQTVLEKSRRKAA
jgi:molybdopterin/thiamine biosynthesis adenylyltransferase